MAFSSFKTFPASAGLWSLYDLSTLAALAGLALQTKGRFSKETKIKYYWKPSGNIYRGDSLAQTAWSSTELNVCDCCACQGFLLCLFFLLTTLHCQEMNKTTRATGMEVVALRLKERTPQESKAVLPWVKYQNLFPGTFPTSGAQQLMKLYCKVVGFFFFFLFLMSFKRFFQFFHYQG